MLNSLKNRKKEQGFTIIEVLIVLAIAGLILLIVFLAVPALQRNSRNTQRKNDASSLGGAVNEYLSNNSGAVPPDGNTVITNTKPGYYNGGSGSGVGQIGYATGSATAITVSTDSAQIVVKAKCNTSGGAVAGSARQVVILYGLETSGGTYTSTCQEV